MTGDARMPTTGSHLGNQLFNYSVGFVVATGLQASRIALRFASRREDRATLAKERKKAAEQDRKDRAIARAEERAARYERSPWAKALEKFDKAICDANNEILGGDE